MLVDDVIVSVKAGNGGNGAVSFRRNAQTARGGPDGGNGGKGGDIFVRGVTDITALQEFQFKKSIKAEDGIKGDRNNLFGRKGKDLVIDVPVGTRITDVDTGWKTDIDAEKSVLIARGGNGGRGNNEFKSATNQTPRTAEKGEEGQARRLRLELRLIADIGLIGLPNAGKSSLLEALTNARPKIANYPFTTLEPNLGVMFTSSKGGDGKIIADIPGLIEGASGGKGLGIKFLKHIEKTRLLLHCIDATSVDVLHDYHIVHKEMLAYNKEIGQKKEIVLLTKRDVVTATEYKEKEKILKNISQRVLSVSIYDEESLGKLKTLLKKTA
ncbi:MAG: GTPase ObgE [bacterium]|nr:GTPase ObgE [bacterium]